MSEFIVWCPDLGIGKQAGRKTEARNYQEAATLYVRDSFYQGDPFDYMTVHVASTEGTTFEVEVEVIADPTFNVYSTKQVVS